MQRIRIALAGCGNWGMNYIRLIAQIPEAELVCVVDTNLEVYKNIQYKIPATTKFYSDYKLAFEKEKPDAVIVSTPLNTHFEICKYALEHRLHVLCEKPVSTSEGEILELKKITILNKLYFFPGHVFIYNQGIQFIKEFLNSGKFGNNYYFNFHRTGLGTIRSDASVTEDLATHDFSILLYLLNEKPEAISMTHFNYESKKFSDTAYITLFFPSKIHATIHVSWIHPIKERKLNIIGSKMMIVFDDTSLSEKVKIFKRDRSYNLPEGDFGEFQMAVRGGDILVPDIQYTETLKLQLNNFVQSVLGNETPKVHIDDALHISKIFGACKESAENGGRLTGVTW